MRQEFVPVVVTGEGGAGAGLSLETIEVSDREGEEGSGMLKLSPAQVTPSLLVLTVKASLLVLSPHL